MYMPTVLCMPPVRVCLRAHKIRDVPRTTNRRGCNPEHLFGNEHFTRSQLEELVSYVEEQHPGILHTFLVDPTSSLAPEPPGRDRDVERPEDGNCARGYGTPVKSEVTREEQEDVYWRWLREFGGGRQNVDGWLDTQNFR